MSLFPVDASLGESINFLGGWDRPPQQVVCAARLMRFHELRIPGLKILGRESFLAFLRARRICTSSHSPSRGSHPLSPSSSWNLLKQKGKKNPVYQYGPSLTSSLRFLWMLLMRNRALCHVWSTGYPSRLGLRLGLGLPRGSATMQSSLYGVRMAEEWLLDMCADSRTTRELYAI